MKILSQLKPGDTLKVQNPSASFTGTWRIRFDAESPFKLVALAFKIVADATVSTRYVILRYLVNGDQIGYVSSVASCAASETCFFTFGINFPVLTNGGTKHASLPDFPLPAGSEIEVVYVGGQAGDVQSDAFAVMQAI